MKTINKILIAAVSVASIAILMSSCNPKTESMGDAGQTLIKMVPDGFKLIPLDAVPTAQNAIMFEVRRDANSSASLNSSLTVVLTKDDALLDAYNADNGTDLIPLPTSLGTTDPAAGADGKVNLQFNPGEFSKTLTVSVPDATQFDFSLQYGLAYKLTSISGTGVISQAVGDEAIIQVGVKNQYDGVYEVNEVSPMVDILNNTLTGYYPFTYVLETSGANSVLCYDKDIWADYMHPILSGDAVSGYGSFGLEIFFDPSGSGAIVDVKNPWGDPPANTRMPAIDPSGVNAWDPVSHDIQFKYFMLQPSLVPDPPNIRVYFDEYWTYKGPR
jgi:hypothetical protein